jgi:hypothetical protein
MFYDQYLLSHINQSSDRQNNSIGLAGQLGKVVASLYAATEQDNEELFGQHFEALTNLINDVYSGKQPLMMNATLDNGLAGLGLALHCLMEDDLIENDSGPLESMLTDIDAFVYAGTKKYFSQGNTAFGTGGEGGLYYLTTRQNKNQVVKKYIADLMKVKKNAKLA